MLNRIRIFCVLMIPFMGWSSVTLSASSEQLFAAALNEAGGAKSIPAKRTYIFWVNGDADHEQSAGYLGKENEFVAVDKKDVEDISRYAKSLHNSNVIILHHRRDAPTWFRKQEKTSLLLRIFNRGEMIVDQEDEGMNPADPEVLANLLKFSERIFPNTSLYLIYRGHSFLPEYDPKKPTGIQPFAIHYPESSYGPRQFLASLHKAKLRRPLLAVVMAACHMAEVELAFSMAPYSHYLVAPQVDILENLPNGFSYAFMLNQDSASSETQIIDYIGRTIMSKFDTNHFIDKAKQDTMWEYPVTVVNLWRLYKHREVWLQVDRELQISKGPFVQKHLKDLKEKAGVYRGFSKLYTDSEMKKKGRDKKADILDQQKRFQEDLGHLSLDFYRLLQAAWSADLAEMTRQSIEKILEDYPNMIKVYNSNKGFSQKTGLSLSIH